MQPMRRTLFILLALYGLWALLAGTTLFMTAMNDRIVTVEGLKSWKTSPNQVRHLLERLRHEKASLVFGTSRAQQISAELLGEPSLNLHYLYGSPETVLRFLQGLDAAQWRNVTRILMLVDFHTLEPGGYPVPVEEVFEPLDGFAWLTRTLGGMNGAALGTALENLYGNLTGSLRYYVDANGAAVGLRARPWNGGIPATEHPQDPEQRHFQAAASLTAIQALARSHAVETVFTTPVLSTAYAELVLPVLEPYAESLAQAVEGPHLFLAVPGLSADQSLFEDASHLNGEGLRRWLAMDWAPYRVTPENVGERVAAIRKMVAESKP